MDSSDTSDDLSHRAHEWLRMNTRRIQVARRIVISLVAVACVLGVGLGLAPSASASTRIAFVRGRYTTTIWTIAANGSGLRQLTKGHYDYSPVWAPARKTIAFLRSQADMSMSRRIMLVSAMGGTARPLHYAGSNEKPSNRMITGLAYSPNGKQLAFADLTYAPSGLAQGRVAVITLKTGKTTVLLRRSAGLDTGWGLCWSPDGKTLLISRSATDFEGQTTWLLTVATRHLTPLGIANACSSAWLPGSKTLVVSTLTQNGSSILIARRNGSVLRTLLTGGGAMDYQPPEAPVVEEAGCSPDGRFVVYTDAPDPADTSLWIMNVDGSGQHKLTVGDEAAWR